MPKKTVVVLPVEGSTSRRPHTSQVTGNTVACAFYATNMTEYPVALLYAVLKVGARVYSADIATTKLDSYLEPVLHDPRGEDGYQRTEGILPERFQIPSRATYKGGFQVTLDQAVALPNGMKFTAHIIDQYGNRIRLAGRFRNSLSKPRAVGPSESERLVAASSTSDDSDIPF